MSLAASAILFISIATPIEKQLDHVTCSDDIIETVQLMDQAEYAYEQGLKNDYENLSQILQQSCQSNSLRSLKTDCAYDQEDVGLVLVKRYGLSQQCRTFYN